MRIPAVKGERADARAVRPRQEFRRSAGAIGKIGAQLRGTRGFRLALLRDLFHAAGTCDRPKPESFLKHAGKRRIGMVVEIEQPHQGVVARGRQPRRRP